MLLSAGGRRAASPGVCRERGNPCGGAAATRGADARTDEPFADHLAQARTWWNFLDGLGPTLQLPPAGTTAVRDPAHRWLDRWLPLFADSYYIPNEFGTAYGLEVSTWMLGDTESATVLVARDPITGAIGGAYTSLV